MDTSDWRTQLRPSTRKRSFNKIMNTLKTYHYFGDEDGLLELQKIAQSFEEKTYAGATSKFDYSRKIAFKLRLMESKFQNTTFKPHLMETSLVSTAQTGLSCWKPNHVGQPFTEEASDWRVQLQPDSRHRIVNKINGTLNKHLPVSGPEGLLEIWRIAQRFEEKIFTTATSQSDYLRKISLKMLTMDTTSRGHHGQPSNQFGPDNKPAGPADRPEEAEQQKQKKANLGS